MIDSLKNEPVQGASVALYPDGKTAITNNKGEFSIDKVKDGIYILTVRMTGYRLKTVDSIHVIKGKSVQLGNISMDVKIETFKKGRVIYRRPTTTVAAGVVDQKSSEQVINVVTAASIKNSQDGDAAKVGSRIPGVTLLENRFMMLRGLSQRYNSVLINNISAPSTETDRRAFSFDLVPSSMLDKMSVYKSPASDLPGDFAGGVIKLYTKSEVESDFVQYSFGVGVRLGTTFKKHMNNNVGSTTDYLGFDNGNRALPSSFPSSMLGFSSSQNILYGKEFRNNYQLSEMLALPDMSASFGFGKNIELGKMKLFTINNFGYGTSYQFYWADRFRYQFDPAEYVKDIFSYKDDNFSIESKFNLLSNWSLRVSDKTMFSIKNTFNQIGENETTIRNGFTPVDRPNDEWKNYSFHYTSRSLYFGQFEGMHKLNKTNRLSYTAGFSTIRRDEPDFRRFRTYRPLGSSQTHELVLPPSANLFDAGRFYSDLRENTTSFSLNYERKIPNLLDSTRDITVRLGAYGENKDREFRARWFAYKYSGDPSYKEALLRMPISEIFAPENINSTAGFKPEEGTNPNDRYDASNQLVSTYINASIPFGKINLNAGVRQEYFYQTLKSATQTEPVNVELENLNILPSFNAAYYFNKQKLLRLAYGRTVNRPEFRELAPFVYYDFMYDVNIEGNPELQSATIDNADIRYEIYPSAGETFSIGAFYKRFINPIENYVTPVGLSQQFFMKNAQSAENMGAEIEFRQSLKDNTQHPFLRCMSVLINASYIYSQVNLGDDSTLSQDQKRPLQGQSPYIINSALQYESDSGLIINVAYNIFGKRIAYVGNNIFPTVYEMPRHALDITVTKEVSKRLNIKFGVSDVLNFKYRMWQDTNADGKIQYKTERTDNKLMEFRRGPLFSFSLSYKISNK